jgi:hypothetical protein
MLSYARYLGWGSGGGKHWHRHIKPEDWKHANTQACTAFKVQSTYECASCGRMTSLVTAPCPFSACIQEQAVEVLLLLARVSTVHVHELQQDGVVAGSSMWLQCTHLIHAL